MKLIGTQSDTETGAYPPEALTELARLEALQHYHKRRNTILALVDARLAGRSEETVWRREDTCSRNTWHAKWKGDALTVEVLATVERMVRDWRDGEELRALRAASRRLALAAPRAAETAEEKLKSADEGVALRAAFGILDRAGRETADKGRSGDLIIELSWDDGNHD